LILKDANDWWAYLYISNIETQSIKRILVIFIILSNEATMNFWTQRCKQYKKTAENLFVCGVFNDSEEANTHTEFLHENGLKVANLENISTALNSIKKQSVAI
jgi:hypothetical protein